jgi:hypothetical protein
MNQVYVAKPWRRLLAKGMAGRPPLREIGLAWKQRQLEARIARRRTACTARMRALRKTRDSGSAQLNREGCQ